MRVFSGRFCVGVAAASVALLAAEAFPPLRAQEEAAAEAGTFPEAAFADVPAFADALEPCWNESADALKRMRRARWETALPADEGGRTLHSAYWRGGKIWGIEAEQIKIEEEKGRAVRLEIMFFNKGDTVARGGPDGDSGEALARKARFSEKAWRDCEAATRGALAALGDPRRCSIGAGKLRRRAEAWSCGRSVFVLDAEKNEFVRVIVVPAERFDELTSSAVERVKSGMKLSEILKKRDSGDVFISTVPMVSQGQKGYCVPATLERVLRYYGIEDLDMHKIAALAGTRAGGGTSVEGLVRGLGPVLKKSRLKFSEQKMSFSKIRQSVNRGVPLIWTMFSTPQYETRMKRLTAERRGNDSAADAAARAKRLDAMEPLAFSPETARKYAHVCLIIGYNSKTKELCVSNSWGDYAREQWVRFEDAETVSHGERLHCLKK